MEPNLSTRPLCPQSKEKKAITLDMRALGRPLNAAKLHLAPFFENGIKALEQQLCTMTRRSDCSVLLEKFSLAPQLQPTYNDDTAYFTHQQSLGHAIISAEQPLIHQIADAYYGGAPTFTATDAAEMNASEKRVQARLGAVVLSQLCSQWQPHTEELKTPHSVLVAVYAIHIGDLRGEICIQLDDNLMLNLASPASSKTLEPAHFQPLLKQQLKCSPVTLNATISRQTLPLSQVLALKAGDIISADIQEELTVYAGPMPLYKARIAEKQNHLVFQVIDPILPPERTPHHD